MKTFLLLVYTFFFITSCNKKEEQIVLLSHGISSDLANYRKKQVSDVVYKLSFSIPKSKLDPIKSNVEVALQIQDLSHPLYLDFNEASSKIKYVVANGKQITVNHQQEHIIIDADFLKLGNNTISIEFEAGDLSLNRNDDYLYTLLVPDRASTLFPCFDQPNIKAHYILRVIAPKKWEVLSASNIDFKKDQGDFIKHQFKKSDKMSTYLFSFVAGIFDSAECQLGDLNMKMLYRENNPEKIEASTKTIFNLHQKSVLFLEDYTHYKFPFQKLDFVVIPGFQYGGMEHVGAIQYNESALFLDNKATQNQVLGRSKLIAHETAHMWFGDLVTMKWFDDVWLKEVFANFLADKITNKAFPDINHKLNFLSEHYSNAYSEDRTKGATPIKQKLDNLKNAGTLYGRIIYNKAPIMMRQLEALVGEAGFNKGIRAYIKTYANSNADWNDLIALLDAETPENLKQWSDVWVNKPSRPIISDSITFENGKIKNFNISQKAEDGSTNIWPQTFKIGLVYNDSTTVITVKLNQANQVLQEVVGLSKPNAIIYNYDAFGYGVFPVNNLDIHTIKQISDDVARGYTYLNIYENVLTGTILPQQVLNTFIDAISAETEELILNDVVRKTNHLFWNYLPEGQRLETGKRLESILITQLQRDDLSSSHKKTIFNLFENIAYSKEGTETLYSLWNKSLTIKDLNLNENDYTSLGETLAIYQHPKSDTILQKTLNRITNPDRKKRFKYLLPSLSKNENERDVFMASLALPNNREKESWVIAALYNVHHPLHQKSAQKHLKMCLDLVTEIQRTGDIFFPKSWLNATIGNYTSAYAYQTLETFLTENPNFPGVLKNKLLQASDEVYRAKIIREKQL